MTDPDNSGAFRCSGGRDPQAGGDALTFNSPVLERLFERERERLVPLLEERTFAPGDLLHAAGAPPSGVFLIRSGEVAVSRRVPGRAFLPSEILRRGDVLAAQAIEGAPREGERLAIDARAVTPTATLLLPAARFEQLGEALPELAEALGAFNDLRASKRRFLAALRRTLSFRTTSPRQLTALFEAAELISVEPGARVVAQGAAPSGLYFVLEGELAVTEQHGETHRAHVQQLYPDDLFGDFAIMIGMEPTTVTTTRKTRLLRVTLDRYEQLLGASSSFRRTVGEVPARDMETGALVVVHGPPNTIEVLLLQSDIPEAPLGVLTDLLARTLASDHGDDIAVIELVTSSAAPGPLPLPTPDPELPRLARLRVPVPDGPGAAAAVEDALVALGGAYEQVFLDVSGGRPDLAAHLAPVLSDRDGQRVQDRLVARGKVVFLSRDPLAQRLPSALRGMPVASAVLVGGPGAAASQAAAAAARRVPHGASRERIYPAGTARVRLDLAQLDALRRPGDRRLAALPGSLRATLSRWGRAITDRSVGIALGGGGAWGFAHVTLIRELHLAGVPIDMVSGSSFGALAGAFYCGAGLDGLELLIRESEGANRATAASLLSSTAIARFVDRRLGHQRLEDLEVPLFPVSTDLASTTEHVVSIGTLGAGVRASGAFPGMFTPVTGGGAYCVDGAFINNVPASVLVTEGADLIIASNIVASPPPVVPSEPLFKGPIGRLLHEFNPLARPLDLIRAGFVLMHASGQRECEFADVVFDADPIELARHERRSLRDWLLGGQIPFWDFTVARQVAAHAEPKARLTVEHVKARWEHLSRGPAATLSLQAEPPPASAAVLTHGRPMSASRSA